MIGRPFLMVLAAFTEINDWLNGLGIWMGYTQEHYFELEEGLFLHQIWTIFSVNVVYTTLYLQ